MNFKTLFLLSALAISTGHLYAQPTYREPFRPHFHFTPATNWMNDPNGMVYYDGEYHLFYQYNPHGIKWGHMSWGHAVSRDLVHWQHLPLALAEENGVMIFSGSAVVDWKNTSGFGLNGKPPLVAIYTGHYTEKPLQNQQIAYSNDRGRTWTKFDGNPVLDIGEKDFRDPKVMWHEPTRRWIMTVAWPNERKVRFYASPDLKQWKHLSDFGPSGSTAGIWECPDLFPLKVEGKRSTPWVLIVNVGSGGPAGGSGCQYFVGNFDGTQFTLDKRSHALPKANEPTGNVLADFEGTDYETWTATGTAFGGGPAKGTFANQQAVSGFRGRGLVNSYEGGDDPQGTLTSRPFQIGERYLNFLIGGGNHTGKTCLNLLIDNRVVRSATGDAAEKLDWKSWDLREFQNRTATIEIVDRHSGGWGHINVDQILLSDTPALPARDPALWADFGKDFYAAVSWSDIPRRDGRRIWLGWMSNWEYANDVPTTPWRSAMSVPRELSLRSTPDGYRLAQKPVRELKRLRGRQHRLGSATLAEANTWLQKRQLGPRLEVEVDFVPQKNSESFGLHLVTGEKEKTVITGNLATKQLSVDRTHSGETGFHAKFPGVHTAALRLRNDRVSLHLLIDTSSVEVFASDGEVVLTDLILPSTAPRSLQLFSDGPPPKIKKLRVWELDSTWPTR